MTEYIFNSQDELKQDATLTITFQRFMSGKYYNGLHNPYIVWRGKQCLYVGISRSGIGYRWFGGIGHMYFVQKYSGTFEGGRWQGASNIGRVVANNFPASLRWKIELRHIADHMYALEKMEIELIATLRPLFNTIYRDDLTPKERRIVNGLNNRL